MSIPVAWQLFLAGLSVGSVYALVALGLVLTFKGTGILNFAQGEFVAFGAYVALFLSLFTSLPFYANFLLTLLIAGIFGLLLERLLLRPLHGAPAFTVVIATLAIGLMIKNVLRMSWQESVSRLPSPFMEHVLVLGPLHMNAQYLWMIGCTLVLVLGFAAVFRFTKVGKAMRAVAQNAEAARLMGIRVGLYFALTFAISAAVGAAAGLLFAPLSGVHAELGRVIIKGFVAAVLGGFQSLAGAVVAGFLIGVAEAYGGAWFGGTFKELFAFILLILILLIRPHGLFGKAEASRV